MRLRLPVLLSLSVLSFGWAGSAAGQADTTGRRDTTIADTIRVRPRPPGTLNLNEEAQARVDNLPLDPTLAGYVPIPGLGAGFRLGGYARLDAMRDFQPAGARDYFVTSSIPVDEERVKGEGGSFNMHIRQTRLNLDVRRDVGSETQRAFFEVDLYGTDGSTALRLRHAYVQVYNLLVGQTYTTFMDIDALPDGVDFEGPPSGVFLLQPVVRYTVPVGRTTSLAFAAEYPRSEVTVTDSATTVLGRWPDLVAQGRVDGTWGSFQAAAVLRDLGYDDKVEGRNRVPGYGLSLTSTVGTFGGDNLKLGVVGGRGIARYVSDVSGLGMDAAPGEEPLQAVPLYGGYAAYQHFWSPKFRSSLIGGALQADNTAGQSGDTFHRSAYGAVNLMWQAANLATFGFEFLYGYHQVKDGRDGWATRLQFAVQLDLYRGSR